MHTPSTKEAQHHSCNPAAPETEAAPPWTVLWGFPKLIPWQWQGAFTADACCSNHEPLAHFRDAGKLPLAFREW